MTDTIFAVPASLDDPIGTPSGYILSTPSRDTVRDLLAGVALDLSAAGVAPDAPWGDAHRAMAPSGPMALPGGSGTEGVFDALTGVDGFAEGLVGAPLEHLYGTSYLHAVSLGPDGAVARGLLAYGQATEPTSPWYYDQLDDYASDAWWSFPYHEADIAADPELTTQDL